MGDHIRETFLPLITHDDTVYAPGFSETAFARIRIGWSQQEVIKELGLPIGAQSFGKTTILYYSQHGTKSKSFHLRIIDLGVDKKVTGTTRSYLLE
jgi:hypothetical protein